MTTHLVNFTERVGGHVVVPTLARCMVEMGDRYGAYDVSLGCDQSAFYVEDDSGVIGALSFKRLESESTYWIYCAYVEPRARRTGVYSAMYAALRKRAVDNDVGRVGGGIAPDNAFMIRAAESVGRRPYSIIYTEEVSA